MSNTTKAKAQEVYDALQKDIQDYLSQGNNKLHFNAKAAKLKELSDEDIKLLLPITTMVLNAAFHTNRNTLVTVSRTIAQEIRQLQSSLHSNSIADEINIGMFLLGRLQECGAVYLGLRKARDNHFETNHILVKDDGELLKYLSDISMEHYSLSAKTGFLPSTRQYEEWTSYIHDNGTKISSRGDNDFISNNLQQKHYDVLNCKQAIPWTLNEDMVNITNMLVDSDIPSVSYIEDGVLYPPLSYMSEEPESKSAAGKLILTQSICRVANALLATKSVFYHQYKFDYRARLYPTSSLLHEQGDDCARGMLDFANKTKLGDTGYDYLLATAASHYGEDKLSRKDRKEFTLDNMDDFIKYGTSPMKYRGWMKAAKKMQFLRACMELVLIKDWLGAGNNIADYETGIVVSIDASTSGAQIMAAITRDSVMGRHVNLTKSDERGDLYQHMAEGTFKAILDDVNCDYARSKRLKTLERERNRNESCKRRGVPYNNIKKYPNRPATFELYEASAKRRIDNLPAIREWFLALDEKTRRLACKRPTMTQYYSSKPYGMANAVAEDVPMPDIDKKYAGKHDEEDKILAKRERGEFFVQYFLSIQKDSDNATPNAVMKILKDEAQEGVAGRQWFSPWFNFPVKQTYIKPKTRQTKGMWPGIPQGVKVTYHDFNHPECTVNVKKHVAGKVANFTHCIDSAHCARVTLMAQEQEIECATIHDSFITTPGHMDAVWNIARQAFIDVVSEVEQFKHIGDGKLDLADCLDNEYSFS